MPVMRKGDISFTQDNTWQYVSIPDNISEVATALILQIYRTATTGWADLTIMEAYPGETSATWDSYNPGEAYLLPDSQQNLVVAWNGYGSLVAKSDSLNGGLVGIIVGYFTKNEFVPFSTRHTLTRDVGAANTTHDITQEDWYVAEAEGYMCGYGDGTLCNTGFKSLDQTIASHSPSVFWPDDSNEVWLYGNVNRTIPGYFTTPFTKGFDTKMRAFPAHLKPLTDTSEASMLSDHQMDDGYAFAIAYCEYNLEYLWPRMLTSPASESSLNGVRATYAGNFYGGRYWEEEVYCYPEQGDTDSGKMFLYFNVVEYYNEDELLLFAAFPRTEYVEGSGSVVYEQPELTEPLLLELQSIAMAIPAVYNTVSGEYTWNGTFVMYLSGGSSNADPALSLGGDVSVTAMGSNLFGDITNRKAQLGGDEYRCVYLKNTSGTETAYGLIVWIENQAELGNQISIGVDPSGVGNSVQTIPNEDVTPAGVDFRQPSGVQNGLPLDIVGPGECVAIWLRRSGDVQNSRRGSDTVTLAFSVANNG